MWHVKRVGASVRLPSTQVSDQGGGVDILGSL